MNDTEKLVARKRIVGLDEGARLRGVSKDTLRRTMSHKFIRLSPGRIGIRIEDVLDLPEEQSS